MSQEIIIQDDLTFKQFQLKEGEDVDFKSTQLEVTEDLIQEVSDKIFSLDLVDFFEEDIFEGCDGNLRITHVGIHGFPGDTDKKAVFLSTPDIERTYYMGSKSVESEYGELLPCISFTDAEAE